MMGWGSRALRAIAALAVAATIAPAHAKEAGTAAFTPEVSQWLAGAAALMRRHSARRIRLADGTEVVAYAPLSAVWIVGGGNPESPVTLAGTARVEGSGPAASVVIDWENGTRDSIPWPEPVPEIVHVGEVHPVAAFHDRLLALPLARSLAGIPAGGRFRRDGTLALPVGADSSPVRWWSLGDTILVVDRFGAEWALSWTEVDGALGGPG